MALGENVGIENGVEEKKSKVAPKVAKDVKGDSEALKQAIDLGWAFIEFKPDGTIIEANDNFLKVLGYSKNQEVAGKHHRIFCDKAYIKSDEYKIFWNELGEGKVQSGEFKRISKNNEEVWIQASYTPVKDNKGNVIRVIKIAADITESVKIKKEMATQQEAMAAQEEELRQNMEEMQTTQEKMERVMVQSNAVKAAVDNGWASIEFETDGTIITANPNFVKTLGYTQEKELIGQHHRIFCDPDYVKSSDYVKFWKDLANGITQSGEFKRIRKDGNEVWINASYSPVMNEEGVVFKVIKIAGDISDMVEARNQALAIGSAVDIGWASIEFKPDGTIIGVNDNFVSALSYQNAKELIGNHHRMFCENEYANSQEYKKFWNDLANGQIQSGEFKRISKNGDDVWIQATYAPIKNENGEVYKVIKIAADISKVKLPILKVSEIIGKIAQGDLTERFDHISEGYVQEMGDALNVALENLNALLGNIEQNSNLLGASSEQMLTKSEQMQGTTQEVASAIGQMAEGVQQQAEQIDESSKLLEMVRDNSNEVASKSDNINKAAEDGQQSAKDGLETVNQVVKSMTEIKESANITSESIMVLTERSEEIARTLKVITDIAAQTNLLALNAAIEAARAGDAGRGFAVVAEEIRKLAEDSRTSAGDIEKVITAVGKDIDSAGKAISTMDKSVKVGNEASENVESVFRKINESTEQTLELSKEVLSAVESQRSDIDNTVKNIEKVVVVSEETAAGTEEIATSSKDLSGGMDEFASTSKSLAEIATQLQQGVSKFSLRK